VYPHQFDVDADSDSDFYFIRVRIFFDAGPDLDPTFHSDQDPDPSLQILAQTHEKCLNRLIFHTFWLVICKLMRIRILIFYLMQIRIFFNADPDAELGYQNDADLDSDPQHC
jgi:hypothetical protein